MKSKGINLIPETKLNAVKNALKETFGVSEIEDIREMTAGLTSALVFRIVVNGSPYLLRIITRNDAMSDPTNQFACMEAAAEARIAPRIWYFNIPDRISITDFVENQPFSVDEARVKLAELLSDLHSLPPFPKPNIHSGAMDGFRRKFQEAKILPESLTDEIFKQYSRITSVYPRDVDLVSCHNDLKPENILFDGERAWLVDWEAAFLNDRYMDLALVGNFVITSVEDEENFLRSYFKGNLDDYKRARFFLARQIAHMSYFTVFMLLGSKGKPIDPNMQKPDFRDFHHRIWTGEISLATDEAKLNYAWVHMEQLMKSLRTKGFEDALSIVSNYHMT